MISSFFSSVKGNAVGCTGPSHSTAMGSLFRLVVPSGFRSKSRGFFTGLMAAICCWTFVVMSLGLRPTLAVPSKTTRPSTCSIQMSTICPFLFGSGLAMKARTGCKCVTMVLKCTEMDPVSNHSLPKACKKRGVNCDQWTVPWIGAPAKPTAWAVASSWMALWPPPTTCSCRSLCGRRHSPMRQSTPGRDLLMARRSLRRGGDCYGLGEGK
mmetsp:Transcript_56757/g.166108  ORF Transcript_56757/g.166108 Transcript_56757/m.166108 type:complete len:211 (-) Transcript_56757:32-664(-)